MAEKHTIHLANGDKVTVVGNRYEVHLAAPIVFHRKSWIRGFTAKDEVSRTTYSSDFARITEALETAFRAVPQVVAEEKSDG